MAIDPPDVENADRAALSLSYDQIIHRIEALAAPASLAGMARFGIV